MTKLGGAEFAHAKAMQYAEDADTHKRIAARQLEEAAEYEEEAIRLAKESGEVQPHAITILEQSRDALKAEAESLRKSLVKEAASAL